MFSSKKDDWETPQWLFDELDSEFHFTLDPCANDLIINAINTLQNLKMDFLNAGKAKRYFVIHHTEEKLEAGSRGAIYIAELGKELQ